MNLSIFNSRERVITGFVIKFLLFLLPPMLLIGFAEYVLFQTGESWPVEKVIEVQRRDSVEKVLYMRGILSQQFNSYKIEGIKTFEPKLLIVGSSRVMKFRKEFFPSMAEEFYNAGGILQCVGDFKAFVSLLENKEIPIPEYLIVGIDPWWFKQDNIPSKTWLSKERLIDHATTLTGHQLALRRLLLNPDKAKSAFMSSNSSHHLGVVAILQEAGFRLDGSKSTSSHLVAELDQNPVYEDREQPPIIERIREQKTTRFTVSDVSLENLEMMIDCFKIVKNLGVEVIAYFPPFSDESYEALEGSLPLAEWWHFYKEEVINGISSTVNNVINLTYPKEMNQDQLLFIDGIHPGEIFVALQIKYFFQKMEAEEISKGLFTSPNYLDSLVRSTSNPIEFNF